MDAKSELVERLCARHSREQQLSVEAEVELRNAVAADPQRFVDTPAEEAFALLAAALVQFEQLAYADDELDDDAYEAHRSRRFAQIAQVAHSALTVDPDCIDAKLIAILATDDTPSAQLEKLFELIDELDAVPFEVRPNCADAYDDVFVRPRLRVLGSASRLCIATTHFGLSRDLCLRMLELAPTDVIGARFTLSLAYARLEREAALDALDTRFGRRGNAWMHLARTLLMFKLDRMSAARRALLGYVNLCEGGAFALARPAYVEHYMPDRPYFEPGSFEEAVLASFEADPIVVDTPDFIEWCLSQNAFNESAAAWAQNLGMDW